MYPEEEGAEGPDLEAFVVGLFSEVLNYDQLKVKLDRVHRVGPGPRGQFQHPRDVLAKLHSFKVNEAILRAAGILLRFLFRGRRVCFTKMWPRPPSQEGSNSDQ